jgi:translation initiation factor 2 alpha subunit (eIF-2alpha)
MKFNYYSNPNPRINELVLVQFIEKCDSFFKAELLEYDYEGIMIFQDATKKKKIISWNKIITLNKNMVARVINVDEIYKLVHLSILDNEITSKKNQNISSTQEILMVYFNENKQLEQFIKSFCIINNYVFLNIWERLIYFIDNERQKANNNVSLWKYFNDNIFLLEEWVRNLKFDHLFYSQIKNYCEKKLDNTKYKYKTKIGIISNIGVQFVKEIINKCLSKLNYNYEMKYTTPYYSFETFNPTETEIFITDLKNEINNSQIFIQILETIKTLL